MKLVAGKKGMSEEEESDAFKKYLNEEKRSQCLEKRLHGRFLKDTEKVSTERTSQ